MAVSKATRKESAATTDDTRSRLLQSAAAVFADRGYERATVRDICDRAKVNVALINYHFGDKLELYTEVLRMSVRHPDNLREVHDLFAQEDEPEELLRNFIHLMLHRMVKRREGPNLHMRLMLHELAHPTPALARVVDEWVKPLHQQLYLVVGRIMDLPPDDQKTKLCTQSIIGQVIHYAHHSPIISRLWPELKMTPEQQDLVANHIADFSLAYLRAVREDRRLKPVEHGRRRTK
ncbi:MAG: CerR family C-terminal domain-containing protein [Bryobacteraceae bacterium]